VRAFGVRKIAMRALNFLVTASVFATLYIGLAVMSALATKVVHEQLASRSSVGVVHQ
jgi:hypothetical protein